MKGNFFRFFADVNNMSTHEYTENVILTAAIDFGTSYSGYAFRFTGETDIHINENWSAAAGMISYKTPTCVLTRYSKSSGRHTFLEFGFKAQDTYKRSDKEMCLFDTFKMKLHTIEEQVSTCK